MDIDTKINVYWNSEYTEKRIDGKMSAILDYGPHFIEKLLSEDQKNAFIELLDLKNMGIDTEITAISKIVKL